ncbi:hypothetical protein [Calothrix sp. NIES-3974]|uniref:hypothetical protein n=1 Tax=Calothrix sp. NIES-3974 TaxID=2005462 RepID=UPI0012FD03AE|nr:hypothetical protein [Calothrix sp. NIES-3974]
MRWGSTCHREGSQAIAIYLVTLWVNKFWILDFPGVEDKHENHKYVADFHGFSAFFSDKLIRLCLSFVKNLP